MVGHVYCDGFLFQNRAGGCGRDLFRMAYIDERRLGGCFLYLARYSGKLCVYIGDLAYYYAEDVVGNVKVYSFC